MKKGFERANAEVIITCDAEDLAACDCIVLPGVGAFRDAMASITPLKEKLLSEV